MSNIIKHITNEAIIATPVVKEIYQALQTATVSASLLPDVHYYIKAGVLKSYADLGFKLPIAQPGEHDPVEYLINELVREVKKNYPTLRIGEIGIAFKRGILKEYGDYMGLSVVSFLSFISGYLKDENRKRALIEKNTPKNKVVIPTQDEVFELSKSNALRALSDTRIGKDIHLYGSIVYGFLGGLKLIELSKEEKLEYFELARLDLIAEYREKSEVEFDRIKRMDLKTLAASLEDIEGLRKDLKTKIWVRAECLAVKDFLQGVIMEETDLAAEIDNAFLMIKSMPN